MNIRGIRNKYIDLIDLLNRLDEPDIIILCETWLKPNDPDPKILDYKFIGRHRSNRKGGGVGFLIKNTLKARTIDLTLNTDSAESLFIEVKGNHDNMLVGSIYRPPNTNVCDFIDSYQVLGEKLHKFKNVLIGLDHNLDLLKNSTHSLTQQFLEATLDAHLIPVITKPTRVTHSSATLIDNILIKSDRCETHQGNIIITNISDHYPSMVTLDSLNLASVETQEIKCRKINEKEIKKIKEILNKEEWNKLQMLDVNHSFNLFHDILLAMIDTVAPVKKIKITTRRNVPWYSSAIKKSNDKDKRLFKLAHNQSASATQINKYREYHKFLQRIKRAAKQKYYRNLCIEFRNNSKRLWKVINSLTGKTKNKNDLVECLKIENIEITQQKRIVKEFTKHFSSVGERLASKIPSPDTPVQDYISQIPRSNISLFLTPTSPEEIKRIICNLPNKKSAGFDKINNILLKQISCAIAEPLSIIFNRSMNEGKFPQRMKLADTVPLYKAKEKYLVDNFPPISLLITLSKILEKLMHNRVYTYFNENNLLYRSQYGFRTRHSCENAVSELVSVILKGHETQKSTVAVFIDLSKAFDTLSHSILLQKLERYGVRGIANDWFKSYLENRKLRCKLNNEQQVVYSNEYLVEYGAPQGSVLGPLLFLLFTNDLYQHLDHCGSILFADDTTIYMSHHNLNYINFCLEHDLKKISDWFKANSLTLNLAKTVSMLFKNKKSPGRIETIKIDQTNIPLVHETKFLGIWLDEGLTWVAHLNKLNIKIKRKAHLLQNNCNLLDCHTLKLIYLAQIKSHINYGLVLWGGMANAEQLNKIKNKQIKCMKLIKPKHELQRIYKDIQVLSVDQLIELEYKKLAYKLSKNLLPPKIMEIISSDQQSAPLKKTHDYNTRKKSLLNHPRSQTKLYQNSFLCRGIRAASELSEADLSCKTLKKFVQTQKKRYISHL